MKEFVEKLKKRLGEQKGNEEVYCMQEDKRLVRHWNNGIDNTIEIINELAEEYSADTPQKSANGWIPCSERLPEDDEYVLCWYEYRIMQGTCVGEMNQTYGIGWYSKHSKTWVGEVSVGVDCKVIAWQPLPQPYHKQEELQQQPEWKDSVMKHFTKTE